MATRKPITRKPVNGSSTSTSRKVKDVTKQLSAVDLSRTRRRLSIMGTNNKNDESTLDGDKQFQDIDHSEIIKQVVENAQLDKNKEKKCVYTSFYSHSKVGYVPFNAGKVNQDRACEVAPFGKAKGKAFFGVFDGHGQLGHQVSQFVATNLPKFLLKQKDLDTNPAKALTNAFLSCNADLTSSRIDCTFSGTTAVSIFFDGDKLYCANAGDSRAILAKEVNGRLRAIPLSSDHKPDRDDEKRRILSSNGRVEACRGSNGQEIGPARVWIKSQDVPGLAMTRSFGDLVAASVGVTASPEIEEYSLGKDDKLVIVGSDGIWEFITSQEAVDIASKADTPEQICRLLVEEADRRWRSEEEVVDDITVLVVLISA